jgi:hypothetical protein
MNLRKTISFLVTGIVLLSFLASCKKQRLEYWGTASVQFNGSNWVAEKVRCSNASNCLPLRMFHLQLNKYSVEGFLRESIVFTRIPLVVGRHKLELNLTENNCNSGPHALYATSADDGDVTKDIYLLDTTFNNYIDISLYNEKSGELKGRFDLLLLVRPPRFDALAPDTLRLRNGLFHTKLLD